MKKIIFIFLAALLVACDPDHTSEYNRINRDDIEGYEEFISKYPSSKYVVDARERIKHAKEEQRRAAEQARIEERRRHILKFGSRHLPVQMLLLL